MAHRHTRARACLMPTPHWFLVRALWLDAVTQSTVQIALETVGLGYQSWLPPQAGKQDMHAVQDMGFRFSVDAPYAVIGLFWPSVQPQVARPGDSSPHRADC